MASPSRALADHWNRRLQFFRFHYAHGGHANDMDTLTAAVRFRGDETGLIELFEKLGVALSPIAPGTPVARLGQQYDSLAWNELAHPIPDYPRFESPAFVRLFGVPAHLNVAKARMDILVSGADGDPWQIDERDFLGAERLEATLPAHGVALIARATIADTEGLYGALSDRGLTDLVFDPVDREAQWRTVQDELASTWKDDELRADALRELQAIAASAVAVGADSRMLGYRFPGLSINFLERVCADARTALR